MVQAMPTAALSTVSETDAAWRVSRDGSAVAVVSIRQEGGEVVVDTELGDGDRGGNGIDPCRFPSLQAADAFVSDLITSFSYLGCDVARA